MAGTAVVLQLISLFFCCVSGAHLQYGTTRLNGSPPNVTLTVGKSERVYCVQPSGPVPTAVEWYNPQSQLVSTDGRDEVNQADASGRAAYLNFQSYHPSQGGRYECRVTGPGNNLEKVSVCIGPTNWGGCVRVTPGVQNTSPTLTVAWQALAGGAVNYTVKYSTQPEEVNTPPAGALEVKGISGTSTILTALERGTTYYIWVVGVSEGREGPHSDRMTGVTYDIPDQVSGVRFVPSANENTLSVEWSRPQSGAPVLYYEFQYRRHTGSHSWLGPVNVTTERVTLRASLTLSATYVVQVRAVSAIGVGPYSSEETLKPLAAPTLRISSGSSWLYVEWNAQSATFRVLYRESGAPDYQVIASPTSQLSHNISALQPNTLYNIVVEATHTVIQQKVNSSVASAYTTPRALSAVSVQVMSAVSIKVSWSLAPTTSNVSVIYYINASSPTYQAMQKSVTDPDHEVVISGLHPFAEYYITVQAGNPGGLSEPTGRSATTLMAAPSAPPVMHVVKETGAHWAIVGWSIPPEAGRNDIIINYIVQLTDTHRAVIRNETVAIQNPTFDSPQSLALNLTSLKPYTRYVWRVAATTTAGAGPFTSFEASSQFRTMQQMNVTLDVIPSTKDMPGIGAVVGAVVAVVGILLLIGIAVVVVIAIVLRHKTKSITYKPHVRAKTSHSPNVCHEQVKVVDNERIEMTPLPATNDSQVDASRVVLSVPDVDGSDYINASYIDGYNQRSAYIASQGPNADTVSDFIQMVWDQRPPVLVMLTRLMEKGKSKCERYWCDEMNKPFEIVDRGFTVTVTAKEVYGDYEVRDMTIICTGDPSNKPFQLKHFFFTTWPNHGVPQHPFSMIKFIQHIRKVFLDSSSPLLVHCSAGVGRTGTFIAIDAMMQRLQEEDDLDIYDFVTQMRTKRTYMVQNLDQYIFIHDVLNDYLHCGNTAVVAHKLRTVIADMQKEGPRPVALLLQEVSQVPCMVDINYAKKASILKRNRYKDRFPYSTGHIHLSGKAGHQASKDSADYYNASFLDGYSVPKAFIAAQSPMSNTKGDFWEMVWQFRTPTIVLLTNFKEGKLEACATVWPAAGHETIDHYDVKCNEVQPCDGYDVIKLEVSSLIGSHSANLEVTVFHYKRWPRDGNPELLSLLEMMGKMDKAHQKGKAALVMCDDGMSRTGVFIAAMCEVERVKVEGEVDIFQTIKAMRKKRPHMVYNKEQYTLCFELLQMYVDSFDAYANFKALS